MTADAEQSGVRVIAVTNRPAHYFRLKDRLEKSDRIRVATGIHPLEAAQTSTSEIAELARSLQTTNYVGEIGLDFSQIGRATRAQQERVFDSICALLSQNPRVMTIHSRGAAKKVAQVLKAHSVGPAIFHWFSGTRTELDLIIGDGHYFSFNSSMMSSAKGREILQNTPRNRILTETDGPYSRTKGRTSWPSDIRAVCMDIAKVWDCSAEDTEAQIGANFARLVKTVEAIPHSPA